ncbi:MAG: hypothetical protein QM654_12825 [Dysgonamonadaceae bacterium]
MQEIDALIDEQTELAQKLVHYSIRNRQAHEELQSFNDIHEFKYIHPLTINGQYKQTQRDQLKKMKEENPEGFLNEITNLNQNIRRIKSNITKKKYKDEEEYQSWVNNINKAEIKRQIIIELM